MMVVPIVNNPHRVVTNALITLETIAEFLSKKQHFVSLIKPYLWWGE